MEVLSVGGQLAGATWNWFNSRCREGGSPTFNVAQAPYVDLSKNPASGEDYTAIAIACERNHTAVILDDGSVKCWGDNVYGQLGIDSTDNVGSSSDSMSTLIGVNLGLDNKGAGPGTYTAFVIQIADANVDPYVYAALSKIPN